MAPSLIGTIKPGPVRKCLAAQTEWSKRYAREKRNMQALRIKEMSQPASQNVVAGEHPPPTALVGRRGDVVVKLEGKRARRLGKVGLKMWSGWGSKHDEDLVERRERAASVAEVDKGVRDADGVAAEVDGKEAGMEGGRVSRSRRASRAATRSQTRSRRRSDRSGNRGVAQPMAMNQNAAFSGNQNADENARPRTADAFLKVPGTVTGAGAAATNEMGPATMLRDANTNRPTNAAFIPVVENGELIPGYIAALPRPEAVRFVTAREDV